MSLTTEQQMLVEQRVTNEAKTNLVAYLLWFFVGGFSAHRFYMGKTKGALLQLACLIVGFLTLVFYVGFAFLLVWVIWLIVDAFLIPRWVNEDRERLRQGISGSMQAA